ncbi:MAG: (2Fe-2S)-binding protein [Elusimicrobiaceae bacterium]|nr:(2Fe-2S)-binding protein [Elusimicrobiaceae bacterium]
MKHKTSKETSRLTGAKMLLNCAVNGAAVSREIDTGLTLADFLRRELGLTGTKVGCGEGECGACVVVVDGAAVNSCLYMAAQAQGRTVLTIEGLAGPDGEPHPIQRAFAECGAVQCGFCTPGMVMSAYALLARRPEPARAEIVEALSGNICRCTGYEKIFQSVERAAQLLADRLGRK